MNSQSGYFNSIVGEVEKLWLEHIKGGTFPREFGNPARRLCTDYDDYVRFIKQARARDCYISVNSYTQDFVRHYNENPKPYEKAVMIDVLYFDLDNEKNLMRPLADVRKLLKVVDARIYFSGAKGFAAYIDLSKPLRLKHPRETLDRFSRQFINELALECVDPHTIGDLARISRIPGTINMKSVERWGEELYCTPLTREEIFSAMNELDVIKIARKPPHGHTIERSPSEEIANRLLEIDEIPITQSSKATWDKDKTFGRHPPCIRKLLGGVQEGFRNEATLRLASYFLKRRKQNKDRVFKRLLEWNRCNRPPLPTREVESVLRSVERGGYKFGCRGLTMFCDRENCAFVKTKSTPPPWFLLNLKRAGGW